MKSIEQTEKIQEKENREKQKRKGTKKRREGIIRRESPSPRPIKKSSTKRSKHLIIGASYPSSQKSSDFAPSKYTIGCTMELSSKFETNASLTNSTSQKASLVSI